MKDLTITLRQEGPVRRSTLLPRLVGASIYMCVGIGAYYTARPEEGRAYILAQVFSGASLLCSLVLNIAIARGFGRGDFPRFLLRFALSLCATLAGAVCVFLAAFTIGRMIRP
jgi:hypothetical protein